MTSILDGPEPEAGAEDKAVPGKDSSQASRTKGQQGAEDTHRAEKDEDNDSTADTGAQHEVREKLDAAIAAALETLELSTAASGSQVIAFMLVTCHKSMNKTSWTRRVPVLDM